MPLFDFGNSLRTCWRFGIYIRNQSVVVPRFISTPASPVKYLTSEDIKVTKKAQERLKTVLDKGERLRVEVDGGGCSGFEYKIKLDTKLHADDRLWKEGNVEIIVDEMSLGYLRGATIDYIEDLMKASFRVVNNPIAEKGCSCGTSFALKMD
uniref:Fe-S_biosyn domain-containing protein n=1 Tax=Heterorhabditis bacteriophora TaxID=37862 RepID=A0A1I7XE12_HETBA